MRALSSFPDILLYRLPVDGRKQIHGLAEIAKISRTPFGPTLFAFISKGRDTVRLLYWDKTGFALWTKKLEKERFKWPLKLKDDVLTLDPRQVQWILDGLDLAALKPHQALNFDSTS